MGIGAYRAAKKKASPEQLVLLLYREALLRLGQLEEAPEKDAIWVQNTHHVRSILLELHDALDFSESPEIGQQLAGLYRWCIGELIRAGREREFAVVKPVIEVITELHDGWMQVVERPQQGLQWAS